MESFNKSEAYRILLQLFRQTYGNAAVICLADIDGSTYIFTILGTGEKIELKMLPVDGVEQGDILYVDSNGDWVRLPAGDAGAPLTSGGVGANPKWNDEIYLKPKSSSSSTAEGTMFYCGDDDHVYVGTE